MPARSGLSKIDVIVLMAFGLFVVGWSSFLREVPWILTGFTIMFASVVATAQVASEEDARHDGGRRSQQGDRQ